MKWSYRTALEILCVLLFLLYVMLYNPAKINNADSQKAGIVSLEENNDKSSRISASSLGVSGVDLFKLIDGENSGFRPIKVIYFRELENGKYEIGVIGEADYATMVDHGEARYYLIGNIVGDNGEYSWKLLGSSLYNLPSNWNDTIALQNYFTYKHEILSKQEYEKFFVEYIDRLYKLMNDNARLINTSELYKDKTKDSQYYKQFAAIQTALYEEAEKAMKISVLGGYSDIHTMLVKAMFLIEQRAEPFVTGNYEDVNSMYFGSGISGGREIIEKAQAAFEAKRNNKVFDENAYNKQVMQKYSDISRAVSDYYDKHFDKRINVTQRGQFRISATRYEAIASEAFIIPEEAEFGVPGSLEAYEPKYYSFIIEKDTNGKWVVLSKEEMK